MTNAANGANGNGRRRWLLYAEDSVTPELRGPYATERERVEAARALLAAPGADAHARVPPRRGRRGGGRRVRGGGGGVMA